MLSAIYEHTFMDILALNLNKKVNSEESNWYNELRKVKLK